MWPTTPQHSRPRTLRTTSSPFDPQSPRVQCWTLAPQSPPLLFSFSYLPDWKLSLQIISAFHDMGHKPGFSRRSVTIDRRISHRHDHFLFHRNTKQLNRRTGLRSTSYAWITSFEPYSNQYIEPKVEYPPISNSGNSDSVKRMSQCHCGIALECNRTTCGRIRIAAPQWLSQTLGAWYSYTWQETVIRRYAY
jgi:hypothetical protein